MTRPSRESVAWDDCTCCGGKVQANGSCPCDPAEGPCAGVLVRPHMCNPWLYATPEELQAAKGSQQALDNLFLAAALEDEKGD